MNSTATTDADVIIAGAGPAGSMAAYHLALAGISTLLLEKSHFPRYKVCGAGLTHKILKEIPFNLDRIIETTIHTFQFSSHCDHVHSQTHSLPLMYCTTRGKLDHYLAEKAREAGASIIWGQQVRSVHQTAEKVEVSTQDRTYRSRLLIGAEGASGIVARSAGLRDHILPGLAWEAEIGASPETLTRYAETVFLDWGTFPGGYGWVFPKSDHFSIGVGGPASLADPMVPYYRQFVLYLKNYVDLDTGYGKMEYLHKVPPFLSDRKVEQRIQAWPIPVRVKKSRFHRGRILVAGDAAGLTDPLTGEGIYYAVKSGQLAAGACMNHLLSGVSLDKYSQEVNDELMEELLEANRIKYLFNTVPLKIHCLVRDNQRVWYAFGKILRGERWYADVKKGFGKWKFLWRTACRLAKQISDYKEKHYVPDEC